MKFMYFCLRLYFKIISLFFFKEINVVGIENIPGDKPCILVSNHSNQFVDGILLISISPYIMSFIGAAKSFKRKIVGSVFRGVQVIPVERPQDLAKFGSGIIIKVDDNMIYGEGTKFQKEIQEGFTIYIINKKQEFIVKRVISDNEIEIMTNETSLYIESKSKFKITPKIDQSKMYEYVYEALLEHRIVSVFPEGGSHDRTDLLPLKGGVCKMALGCVEKYNQSVFIIPCGLNYFKGHRFRSKVNIEFGKPIEVSKDLANLYSKDKKIAIEKVLQQVEKHLRDVIVTAPSFQELQTIYMAKRLYKPDNIHTDPEKELLLNIRFACAYRKLKNNEELRDCFIDVRRYIKVLKALGIRDLEVRRMRPTNFRNFLSVCKSIFMLIISSLIALPGIIIMSLPAHILNTYAERERVKALKGSTVKIYGRDVIASYKITLHFVVVPVFTILYYLIFFYGTGYYTEDMMMRIKCTLTFMITFPFYSYFMVRSSDGFFTHSRLVKSKLLFFFNTNNILEIKRFRTEMQKKIQTLVDKYYDISPVDCEKEKILTLEQIKMAQNGSEDFAGIFDTLKDIGV